MKLPESISPKFLAMLIIYFAVLLFNVADFIIPSFSVIYVYQEFYIYLLLMLAPLAPLSMMLAGTEITSHHRTVFTILFAAMTLMSVFATIFFTLPAVI